MQPQSQITRSDSERLSAADREVLDALDRLAADVAQEQLAKARSELSDDLTQAQQAELAALATNIATEVLEPVREAIQQGDLSPGERRRLAAVFLGKD